MASRDMEDLAAGAVLGVLGLFVAYEGSRLPYLFEFGPGPGFLPLWLGIGIVALSSSLIGRALWRATGREPIEDRLKGMKRSLGAWAAIMCGVALVERLGFFASFMILTASLSLLLDRRSAPAALAIALGVSLALYLIFSVALRVPLPRGPWGF